MPRRTTPVARTALLMALTFALTLTACTGQATPGPVTAAPPRATPPHATEEKTAGQGGPGDRDDGTSLAGHSADLRAATVAPAADGLRISFELGAPADAAEPESVVWAVEFLDGTNLAATVSAQRIGARLVAAVYDWRSGEQTPVAFTTEGSRLELTLPDRPGRGETRGGARSADEDWRMAWRALTQRDGADAARLPAEGEMVGYGTIRAT